MMTAGMAASAHLTMNTTMDPNGMLMSVTTTGLALDRGRRSDRLDVRRRERSGRNVRGGWGHRRVVARPGGRRALATGPCRGAPVRPAWYNRRRRKIETLRFGGWLPDNSDKS